LADALLLIASVPLSVPVVAGANFTLSVAVCFGLNVIGNAAPDTVNPVPLMLAELIVTAAVPVEVSVTGSVALDPVVTLPKLKYVGLIVNCGCGAVAPVFVPVLVRLTTVVALVEALLLMVKAPVSAPVALGAACT
jgi:hypothetical protein